MRTLLPTACIAAATVAIGFSGCTTTHRAEGPLIEPTAVSSGVVSMGALDLPAQSRRETARAIDDQDSAAGCVEAPPRSFILTVPGSEYEQEMILVPAGTFGEESTSVRTFYMSKTEITWDLYDVFVFERDKAALEAAEEPEVDAVTRPSRPYVPPDRGFGHEGYPVISVSFQSAQKFCEWLSARTGRTFRLPTEIEWEYAARANEPFDPAHLDDIAWYEDNADWTTHPVGKKQPNAFGLYDMLGNAAEWCIAADGEGVLRGGHFDAPAHEVSPDARMRYDASWQMMDPQVPKSEWWLSDAPFAGFRVVCEIEQRE